MTTIKFVSIAQAMLRFSLVAALTLLGFASASAEGSNPQLDAAKSAGHLGEQADGYLGVVADKDGAAALAADINAKRRAEYERIAAANNITADDVAKVAGKKALEKTPAGQYIKMPGGDWQKK